MKIERLDAHDRLDHLKKDQSNVITQGCEDCLKTNPDSLMLQERCHYIYIFAHPRTADDGVNKRMLWQPRLNKPKAQTNSYLFRATSKTHEIEICWMIPPRELWDEYKKGNLVEHQEVIWSIDQFLHNRKELEEPFHDDISSERSKRIWLEIAAAKEEKIRIKKMWASIEDSMQESAGPFPFSLKSFLD